MKFNIFDLKSKSANRPSGYYEDILSHSTKISDFEYEIPEDQYELLCLKYRLPEKKEMIFSIMGAAYKLLNKGKKIRPPDKINEALHLCIQCPFFIENGFRCGKCGCFLKIKVFIEQWKCPLGKW